MINFLLVILLTVITFPSLQAAEHDEHHDTSNTTAQLLDLFAPHHAMGGFSRHHKDMMMITHQCFTVTTDDGRQDLLNMFDYHGAMHGFTETNKVAIFKAFCKLPKRFHSTFKKKILTLFNYNGILLTQSEAIKVFFFQRLQDVQHQEALQTLIQTLAAPHAPWHLISDHTKKILIDHVAQTHPLSWYLYTFNDFLQEFEKQGLLYHDELELDASILAYYGDLTAHIQSFIYASAQFLNQQGRRILINLILLHSGRFAKFTTPQRQRVITKSCRDLAPIISRLKQTQLDTPKRNSHDDTSTLHFYDELFDYFEPASTTTDDLSAEMEELD